MSDVDRLSNSGLYPALPIADQRRKEGSPHQQRRDSASQNPDPRAPATVDGAPRPPKSLIDEYA